jgi:cytoskeletal protein RodZ
LIRIRKSKATTKKTNKKTKHKKKQKKKKRKKNKKKQKKIFVSFPFFASIFVIRLFVYVRLLLLVLFVLF